MRDAAFVTLTALLPHLRRQTVGKALSKMTPQEADEAIAALREGRPVKHSRGRLVPA